MKVKINDIKKTFAEYAEGLPFVGERKNVIEKMDVEEKSIIAHQQYKVDELDTKNYHEKVIAAVKGNAATLSSTAWHMESIKSQNDLESFFKQNSNTKDLAKGLSSLVAIQQSSLDLLMLLNGATARTKDAHDELMENLSAIESQLVDGNGTLDYFANLKRAVLSNKERLDAIKGLQLTVNELIDRDTAHDEIIEALCKEIEILKAANLHMEMELNQHKNSGKTTIASYISIVISFFAFGLSIASILL